MTDQSPLHSAEDGEDIPSDMLEHTPAIERYVSIKITKGAKEYRFDTTVSLRWASDGVDANVDANYELRKLNHMAHDLARTEITSRELVDTMEDMKGSE